MDGEHGARIQCAAWSPVGPNLAYQIYSSGGHQPYYLPITVFEVETGAEVDLQEILDRKYGEAAWEISWSERDPFWSGDGKLHFEAVSSRLDGSEWTAFTFEPGTWEISNEPIGK